MTILVTGANGGFGKVFTPLLRNKYKESIIATGRDNADIIDYFSCDITSFDSVTSLIKRLQPRLIFHLAGSFTGQFEDDFRVNVLSTKYIFESVLSEKIETRVVLIGSAAEYGVVNPADNPIPESFPCNPVSVYGLTKYYQTELALFYARTKVIDVVVARIFNLAIPGLSTRLFYGRAEALIRAYKDSQITNMQFGNLSNERDYIGIDEVSAQLLAIAECGLSGQIYNVGSGLPKTIRSILLDLLSKNGIPAEVIIESSSESIGRKGFDVPVIYANIAKVSHLLAIKNRSVPPV